MREHFQRAAGGVLLTDLGLWETTIGVWGWLFEEPHRLNDVESFLDIPSILLHLIGQGLKLRDGLYVMREAVGIRK